MRESISAKMRHVLIFFLILVIQITNIYVFRLAVTFLATGETYRSLMFSTRIHVSTIASIVPQVCRIIYQNLKKVQQMNGFKYPEISSHLGIFR